MTLSDSFKFNPKAVNRYQPKIMSYLTLAKSSTCKFHITLFFAKFRQGKIYSNLYIGIDTTRLYVPLHHNVLFRNKFYYQTYHYNRGITPTMQQDSKVIKYCSTLLCIYTSIKNSRVIDI